MDFITYLKDKTLKIFNVNVNTINEVLNTGHYSKINNLIEKHRKRKIETNAEHILQLAEHGIITVYSEIFKFLIVLLLARCLNMGILLTTFFVMTIFTLFRRYAGGVHLSTFNKCFGAMIIFFISLGWLATKIHINYTYLIIGYIISLYFTDRYAPLERKDKSDKDYDNGNVKKHKSMRFVILTCMLSIVLFKSHEIISTSIFLGVLLETSTFIPIGTKLFKWIDGDHI